MQQKYYQASKQECMQQFSVSAEGLSESEVEKRSAESRKKMIKNQKHVDAIIQSLFCF